MTPRPSQPVSRLDQLCAAWLDAAQTHGQLAQCDSNELGQCLMSIIFRIIPLRGVLPQNQADCAQQIVVEFFTRLRRSGLPESVERVVCRLASQRGTDFATRLHRAAPTGNEQLDCIPDPGPSPVEQSEAIELYDLFRQQQNSEEMKVYERIVVVGETNEQAAESLGMSIHMVRKHRHSIEIKRAAFIRQQGELDG